MVIENKPDWQAIAGTLANHFVEYAEHQGSCRVAAVHDHTGISSVFAKDRRMVCELEPCTCGLVEKLQELMSFSYMVPCPISEYLERGKVLEFVARSRD
jgi:hypothetical protein